MGTVSRGSLVTLSTTGQVLARTAGPYADVPPAPYAQMNGSGPSIPWPLLPNGEHPIGNTYNEYQNYGGSPYPHPGVDIFGDAGQHVYAVRSGVVKAVLTTGGDLYWRVAIADTSGSGTLPGYLCAHLVQSSIAVTVGQQIQAGQYLGDLVAWPVTDFNHTHFARVQDTGTQWFGDWTCIGNPQLYLQNQSDALPPVFEPARGTDLLAFCANETSTYLSPQSLHGPVDIIAHVGDRVITHYVCTVQELRYSIYPQGHYGSWVVDNKLAVFFDMTNDYYAGGTQYATLTNILYKQDSDCHTYGDYTNREFFHILTNSDGDQSWGPEDLQQSWDTSLIPDGPYVIRVTARDVFGNSVSDSMVVRTMNGISSGVIAAAEGPLRAQCRPNPTLGPTTIVFATPVSGPAALGIYDPAGRRVRTLVDGVLAPGQHESIWDGLGESGAAVPAGVYFFRISTVGGVQSGKIVFRP